MRRRLAAWVAADVAPAGLAPASIAAAYVRATGRPPARDPDRRALRAYSAQELAVALAELGHRPPRLATPPADPLLLIWAAALQRLALPSTRILLSQQCCLLELRESGRELLAVLGVSPEWLALVQSRRDLVAGALAETMSRPVAVELVEAGR